MARTSTLAFTTDPSLGAEPAHDPQRWLANPVALGNFRKLSKRSEALYTTFWNAWLKHLSETGHSLTTASVDQAQSFLERPSRDATPLTPTTRARYRRVLHAITAAGVAWGALQRNVFDELGNATPRRERTASTAFLPPERAALLQLLSAPADSRTGRRDRILVCLLLADGLTLGEALAARASDLHHHAARPTPSLDVRGSRACQRRTVSLHPATSAAIADLQRHASLAPGHFLAPALPDGPEPTAPASQPSQGSRALSRHRAFRAAKAFLLDAHQAGAIRRLAAQHGPTTLRNSAIVAWLDEGMPLPEVLRHAGLERLDALDRIARFVSNASRERLFGGRKAQIAAGLPSVERYKARRE